MFQALSVLHYNLSMFKWESLKWRVNEIVASSAAKWSGATKNNTVELPCNSALYNAAS